jgi:metal-dependent HD superfamily phosphatase/phosphodiesterase
MSQGRSRIPYEGGNVDIYSVSAAAIDNVEISEGRDRPIHINILMNNSAGLFQVDELLKRKLQGSGIEDYVKVRAIVEREKEKRLIEEFEIS